MRRFESVMGVVILALAGCGDDKSSGPADGVLLEVEEQDTILVVDTVVAVDTVAVDTAPAVDTYEPPKPGEFGYACNGNDDCNSGWCIQTASGRKCTRTCVEECPDFFDCREAPGTDATFICVPTFTHLCDPCDETSDCNEPGQTGNFCLGYGPKGKFCGGACNNDANCPGGYVCRNVPVGGGGQAKQCVPPDGQECRCSDLAKSLQLSTTCFIENEDGKCEGKRFCTQSGLNLCDAADPFPESCNGIDDNCNGAIDDFPPDYQCLLENEFGACKGQGTCADGVETCVGTAPKPEQCNGIDDDCDGATDEDLCDDQNPCTIDFCNSEGACAHQNDNTKLCDDGSVCTQVDKCLDGFCVGYNPLPCGDGNPCYSYQCDPVAGCLTQYANAANCEDGQPCTKGDKCNLGVCVAGSWDTCDDGNPCTIDNCVTNQGCTHTPATNGIPCGGGAGQCTTGQCSNGVCLGVPVNEAGPCTPTSTPNQCQQGLCRVGQCKLESKPDGAGCAAPSSDCPTGQCNGGQCLSKSGVSCTAEYGLDLCQTVEVTGQCTANGDCNVSSVPAQYTCPGCNGICIKCFFQFCIPLF